MGLRTYRRKRDFARTPEPHGRSGKSTKATGDSFVVQKHAARSLHHDFRLELDGVLLSWAVPKGPPTQPGQKVLAVRTEDHPLEYGTFEGTIPEGQYGGGTVMLWDRGTWTPEGDPQEGLRQGRLHFRLHGERLRGRWSLVRMGKGRKKSAGNWLLIRRSEPDAAAADGEVDLDRSVATGRTMAEIAAGGSATGTRQSRAGRPDPAALPGARSRAQPRRLTPQLATLVQEPPAGAEWLHEIKFDGYRMLAFLDAGEVRLRTRTGQDWTDRFPTIAEAIAALPVAQAVLDGEVALLDAAGRSDFQGLQNSLDAGRDRELAFHAFDLPHCEGHDLTAVPLLRRKELLRSLLPPDADGPLRYSDHVVGHGPTFVQQACLLALEGAISKRVDAPYLGRRTRTWLKTKCLRRQEFVVGGYTEPGGSRRHLGALLLGLHRDSGLHYAGKVGTGFTEQSLADLARRLRPLASDASPFVDPPREAGVHWVRPRCVVEVAFTEWTRDGRLRHPSFQGVREDKPAAEVHRERPAAVTGDATVAGIAISHPDRVVFPGLGLTKLELCRYYATVKDAILPGLRQRPLTLVRCPRGQRGQCFFQKHVTDGMPDQVRAIAVREKNGKTADYVAVDDAKGLIALVQFGAIEFHPWSCRADRLDRPDRLILDLDPGPGVAFARVAEAANRLRELLAGLGLRGFPRTSGGKGLHVVLPIERRTPWAEAKAFARDLAAALARTDPNGFVLEASKAARRDRIFVDYLRNDRGATAVANWSVRARPGAPVAMPLRWDEVGPSLSPQDFTVATAPARLARNPWADLDNLRQVLTADRRAALRKA